MYKRQTRVHDRSKSLSRSAKKSGIIMTEILTHSVDNLGRQLRSTGTQSEPHTRTPSLNKNETADTFQAADTAEYGFAGRVCA